MSATGWVWIGGKLVAAEQATVSVFDRSFLYGDGLFETVRLVGGKPFRWPAHMERLASGARFLGIQIPNSDAELHAAAASVVSKGGVRDGTVRIHLTRGVGRRGYSTKGADSPQIIITTHPAPAETADGPRRWSLRTASFRVAAGDPLAGFKTASKLVQVMARAEAEAAGDDEALVLNTDGLVAESSSGNVFWIESDFLHTPPLTAGLLPGITRSAIIDAAYEEGLVVIETNTGTDRLKKGAGVFLTMSSLGVVAVSRVDGTKVGDSPLVARIHAAYERLLIRDAAWPPIQYPYA